MHQARVATTAAFAAQGLMFTVLLTHLPQFTDRYRISEGTVTVIVFLVTVLAGVGSVGSEALAGARSSRTALRFGLLVIALAGALIGVAPTLAVFVLGFAVYGIGLGMVDAAGNMQAVAVQHRYGRSIITSFHAAWSGAAIVSALYVAGGERLGVSLPGSILPVATLVLLVLVLTGPRLQALEPAAPKAVSPTPTAGVGTVDGEPVADGRPATDGRSVAVAGAFADIEHVPGARPVSATDAADSQKVLSLVRGPLLALGLAMTCFWAVDSGVSNWSALYLRNLLHASNSTAALGFAFYQAMGLISRLSGDTVVRRYGAVLTVRAAACLGTAGTMLVVLAPGPAVAIAGFGLVGLGLPVIAPLCFSAAGAAVRAAQPPAPADPTTADPTTAAPTTAAPTTAAPDADTNTGPDGAANAGPDGLPGGGALNATDGVVTGAVDSAVARLNVFNYLGSLLGAVLIGTIGAVADLRAGFVVPVLLALALLFLARAFAPARPTPSP